MRLVVRKKNFIFRMYVVVGGLLFWEAFFTPPRGGEGVIGGPGEHSCLTCAGRTQKGVKSKSRGRGFESGKKVFYRVIFY